MIAIIDFGSQYTMLIARKVRELGFYSEIIPCTKTEIELKNKKIDALILSGSPFSVYSEEAPGLSRQFFSDFEVTPVLAVCYGMQLITHIFGGEVGKAKTKEYGKAKLNINNKDSLFKGLPDQIQVWMSHGDSVIRPPEGYDILASTNDTPYASFRFKNIFAVQFHPEVYHTEYGLDILRNFLENVALVKTDWTEEIFIEQQMEKIKKRVGKEKVLVALSGGVDSTVVAFLLERAIGKQLYTMYIDTGLMRKGESEEIIRFFSEKFGSNFIPVDAKSIFYKKLKKIIDPEKKRKIIGKTFIEIFNSESKKLKGINFLAQGTLYPDIIESVSFKGPSVTIKSHHNVGGLPKNLPFELIEPLRELFKDEVRRIGNVLGIPRILINRKPFPGPGLAIRILGEITQERVGILQEADYILREIISGDSESDKNIWQLFAVLLPVKSVGVMGDERTYEYVCAIRAVSSSDGMTADWYPIPYEILGEISSKIVNNVKGINRVVYDITSKPPATIEWE